MTPSTRHIIRAPLTLLCLILTLAAHGRAGSNLQTPAHFYDDERVAAWARDYSSGNREQVISSVERDLRSAAPHFMAAHVWTVTQHALGRLEKTWQDLQDAQLKNSLGPLPEIFLLFQRGQYKLLLEKYPPSSADKIKDVWALNYLALACDEMDRDEGGLLFDVAIARLRPDNFQTAWVLSHHFMPNEKVRPQIASMAAQGGRLSAAPLGQFLNNELQRLPTTTRYDENDLSAVEAWLAVAPHDARALRRKALVLVALNRPEEAVRFFEQSSATYPFMPNWREHATTLLKLGRPEQARAVVERSAALASESAAAASPLAERRMAIALRDAEMFTAARKLLATSTERWPGEAALFDERADLELKHTTLPVDKTYNSISLSHEELKAGLRAELFSTAIPFARKAAQLGPDELKYQVRLMDALRQGALRHAALPSPVPPGSFERIGEFQAGLLAEAYALFESAEKRFAQKSKELYSTGSSLLEAMGRAAERVRLCERAVNEYPGSAWMVWELADALQGAGRKSEALERLRASFEIEAPNAWAVMKFKELVTELSGASTLQSELVRLSARFPWNESVSRSLPKELRKYDDEGGPPHLRIQNGHTLEVMSVAFGRKGDYVVTGGGQSPGQIVDGTIKIWERSTGRLVRTMEGHAGGVRSVAFGPNDESLVSTGIDRAIKLWDVKTGRLIWKVERQCCGPASFNHDGTLIVAARAKIWEARTGRLIEKPFAGEFAAFHPRKNLVATNSGMNIKLWDADAGVMVKDLGPAKFDVTSIAISPDGTKLAVGAGLYDNNAVQIWDLNTYELKWTIEKHQKSVEAVAFSRDSKHLASFSRDETVKVWSVQTGELVRTEKVHGGWGGPIAFSPTDDTLAAGRGYGVYLSRIDKPGVARFIGGETNSVQKTIFAGLLGGFSAEVSADGKYVAVGGAGRSVEIWERDTGRLARTLDTDIGCRFSPAKGSTDLAIYGLRAIQIIDPASGQALVTFGESKASILGIAFNSDGTRIFSAHLDGSIGIWDTKSGAMLDTLQVVAKREALSSESFSSIAVSPDGRFVVVGDSNQLVSLWDVRARRKVWPADDKETAARLIPASHSHGRSPAPEIISSPGTYLAFSPDGTKIAMGVGYDENRPGSPLFILDAATGDALKSLSGHSAGVIALAFSPDGKLLATGSRDNTIRVWETKGWRPVGTYGGHDDDVDSVRFTPDGKFIISASNDNTVKIWEAPGGDESAGTNLQAAEAGGRHEMCTLVSFTNGDWAVVDDEGRFDTNNLERARGMQWVVPDDPMTPLPIEIFMREFYEPRLLTRRLDFEDMQAVESLADLNRVQPRVEIKEIVKDGPETVSVTVEIESVEREFKREKNPLVRSGAKDLRLFRDGQLVRYRDGNLVGADSVCREHERVAGAPNKCRATFEKIQLPRRASGKKIEFSAYGFNQSDVKSETHRREHTAPALAPARGRAYIISVGVSAYENMEWKLEFAADDARLVRDTLEASLRGTKAYEDVIPVLLTSEHKTAGGRTVVVQKPAQATKDNVKRIFEVLAGKRSSEEVSDLVDPRRIGKVTPEDIVIIFYSGHGFGYDNQFYLMPFDIGTAEGRAPTPELAQNCISSNMLSLWLRDIDAAEITLIVDACHSGAVVTAEGFKPGPMGSHGMGQMAYDKGMSVLGASQEDKIAGELNLRDENGMIQQGALTHALIQNGIKDWKADTNGDGKLDLSEWLEYGVAQVPVLYARALKRAVGREAEQLSELQRPALFDFTSKVKIRSGEVIALAPARR